jgi:hypothetical protein
VSETHLGLKTKAVNPYVYVWKCNAAKKEMIPILAQIKNENSSTNFFSEKRFLGISSLRAALSSLLGKLLFPSAPPIEKEMLEY